MAKGSSIKGITIELNGDATGLDKALKGVNDNVIKTQNELTQVNKLLKFDPSNVTLLAQKQELLTQQIQNTTDKLKTLKTAQEQVEQQFKNGDIGADQYRAFQRELAKTEADLKSFQKQADNIEAKVDVKADTTGIDKMKSSLKELGPAAKQAASEIGDALKTAGAAGSAAVGAIVIGSNDLNMDLARLRTNAEIAGRDLGLVEEAFKKITAVTGETDSAVETVSNLLASGFTDEQLSKVIDNVNGAAIKFSDTLKTEGIADGIQETFATGAAIGPFAELLERSGVNLDTFNEGLANAKKEGEGANYILEQMSSLGLAEISAKYQELNPEVTKNAEATINMQTALAELAIVLTPLVTMITEVITKFVEWASNNPTLATTLAIVSGAITGIVGIFTVLSPIISAVTSLWPVLASAIGAISAPVAAVVAGIAALIAIGVALWKNWDEVSAFLSTVWEGIKSVASNVFSAISDVLTGVWESIKSTTESVWNGIKDFFSTIWDGIKTVFDMVIGAIKSLLDSYWNSMGDGIKTVWEGIKQYFSAVWDLIKNVFVGALLVVLQLLTGQWDEAKKSTEKIWSNIQKALEGVWDAVKKIFSGALDAVKGYITTSWETIKSTTSTVFNTIKSTISTIWDNIKTSVTNTISNIVSTVSNKFKEIVNSVREKMNNAFTTIKEIWGNVTSFLSGINLYSIGKNMIEGLINGVKSMAKQLVNSVKGVVDDAIKGAKNLLGIKSPSRVFMEMGEFTNEGFVKGIERSSKQLNDAVGNVYGSLASSAQKSLQGNSNVTNTTSITNSTPINVVLNYSGTGSTQDARQMVDFIESELGNRLNSRLRMSGVKG